MSTRRSVVVVGDVVLDRDVVGRSERLCPDAPVPVVDVEDEVCGPGAAGLTALLCRAPDVAVTLVAPVGDDPAGAQVRELLEEAGVSVVALAQRGPTRTKTRVRSGGQSLLRLDDGGPGDPVGGLPDAAVAAVRDADVVVVSCYGAGTTAHPEVRERLAARAADHPVLWDPHPRGGTPVPGCLLVTPNAAEARAATADAGPGAAADGSAAHDRSASPVGAGDVAAQLRSQWQARAVAVTEGGRGAWVSARPGPPRHVPTAEVAGDPCGAGDAFVAAAAVAVARGKGPTEAVVEAVRLAGDWVAGGGVTALRRPAPDDPAGSTGAGEPDLAVVHRARRAGGTVVATGGCFDILHAGHLSSLEAARALGDTLVVLLNSDASVRRLKGPTRPVQPAHDRARVLRGLACVDAVIVFDDDTPEAALADLRPDIWAKGGDYAAQDLPESALVETWGGRVVLLPYLSGRSTTAILAAV
jgi:D-beta-D-heptose 7-phosphate kinase / D-beta-D-heptose 1-phosphate adenosyltransferase